MAIGLTPKHTTVYPLHDITREQFLILALETAARSGWQIHYFSGSGLIAVSTPWAAEVVIKIEKEYASISSCSPNTRLIDWGKNKKNVEQFIATLTELKATIPASYLAAKYEEVAPFLPPTEHDALLRSQPKERSQIADLLAVFRPVKDYFVTPIILNLNLFVFVLMALAGVSLVQPDSSSLIHWGANYGPLTLAGEWWRLVTCCFLHIGIVHLVMNMYAFLLIGAQLEPRLGKLRFSVAYLVTGIIASGTSLYWHSNTISAGASGAIFGMYGVFLAMLTTDLVEKRSRKQLLASILFFVVYNLLGGLKEGVDNAAHIGGLLSGLLIGYSLVRGLKKAQPQIVPVEALPEVPDYY